MYVYNVIIIVNHSDYTARGCDMYVKLTRICILTLLLTSCMNERRLSVEDIHPPELKPQTFRYSPAEGLGHEPGCTRRDPSDVVDVDGTLYVWYTKVFGRASGYWGTVWYATSVDNGQSWTERGEALGTGNEGAFDSQAIFTPNIIAADDKYYLYYTGVKPTPERDDGVFENNSTTDITAIGVAVADSPDGPFTRVGDNPVLEISEYPEAFDSYRVDDAALLFRDGRYLLYYKGRSRKYGTKGPMHTEMGVAYSDNPTGPWKKHGQPILSQSHEVLIWPHRVGVAALASFSSTFEYAVDGIDFTTDKLAVKVVDCPMAPGAYRPDLTKPVTYGAGLNWGISMVNNGDECYLIRFECDAGVDIK